MAASITLYYRPLDIPEFSCGVAYNLEFKKLPHMSFDYVPKIAREGLGEMIESVGLKLHRGDGGGGVGAYFHVLKEGLTIEKVEELINVIENKVCSLKGKDFKHQFAADQLANTVERAVEIFNAISEGKNTAEKLFLLRSFVNKIDGLSERAKDEISRKLDAMKSTFEGLSAA